MVKQRARDEDVLLRRVGGNQGSADTRRAPVTYNELLQPGEAPSGRDHRDQLGECSTSFSDSRLLPFFGLLVDDRYASVG